MLAVRSGEGEAAPPLVITLGPRHPGGGPGPASAAERAHVVLEGPLSDAYYRVRAIIYSQYGAVA